MKIVITGANGMLGSSLCRLFYNEHEIYAFHRNEECLSHCSFDFSLDLTNSTQLHTLLSQIKPECVIHCAGFTSVDGCEKEPDISYETNVMVTENIARSCHDKIKLIYISSDQVYGETNDRSEANEMLRPANQYGKTKLQGEQKVHNLCDNYIVVRTNIFGWNVKPGRISSAEWIYHSLKNGQELNLFTDYIFSPIYTGYLGQMLIQLIQKDFRGIINIGSTKSCSKYDFGIQLAKEFRLDQSLINKGSVKDHQFIAIRPKVLTLNCNLLAKLNSDIKDWKQSIGKFAEENGKVKSKKQN